MIKKSTFLFFFVFMLLKTEIFAMATETETEESRTRYMSLPTETETETEIEEPRSRYMPVFMQIVRFHEFLSEGQDDVRNFQKLSVAADLSLSSNLRMYGEKLLKGEITGDFFFRKLLLEPRLEYLFDRTNLAKSLSCVPSESGFLEYMQKYRKDFIAEENEEARARNLQRYQFLNLLASSMFKILRRDELSDTTVKLLRASPKLWPLLKGETRDLGHPDEAGGYAIVKAYLENLEKEDSFDFFDLALSPPARAVKKIIQKVICPLWEQEKLFIDAELYENHFKEKVVIFCSPLKDPWIKQTYFECGVWESDLPYPDFLQPASKLTETEELIPLKPSFFDIFPFEKLDAEEEIPEKDTSSQASSSTGATSSTEATNSTGATSSTEATSSTDFIMPSGIRKFHALMPKTSYPIKQLLNEDQKFIDVIFDERRFAKITYKKFQRFWEKQKGRIAASHGGSHRLLVGPNGDSLSGTYTHGRGQTYTPKTIKYLRAALWYIGCRPSE